MASTRASAIRLLTSSRSIILPEPGRSAETRTEVVHDHSIIRRGFAPRAKSHKHVRRVGAIRRHPVLAQAIKTDTDGIIAGDQVVKIGSYEMPVYEARPATGKDHAILLVISEIWGAHEYVRIARGGSPRRATMRSRPSSSNARAGWRSSRTSRNILKIVLAQKREQTLGDLKAAVDWAKTLGRIHGVPGGGHERGHEGARSPGTGPPARPYQG